ncbi:MAG: glycosyltransferase [Bacteroidales bacterium]
MIAVFIVLICIVFYTYIGYGILLYFLVKLKESFSGRTVNKTPEQWPEVTLLIAAYNEEDIIDAKMSNCYSLDYPAEKLHITWVTDGSTDKTNSMLANYKNVTVLFMPERKGKTAAINRAMDFVNTPVTIFTDANTMLNKDSIREIVLQFEDETVGCVAGEKRVITDNNSDLASVGEGLYWKYESFLKELDSRLYSVVGAAGELFAVRTIYYHKMPVDTLLDDFVMSLQIAMNGYRTSYCKKAYASESGSANIAEEKKRKVRIAAGGLQAIYRLYPLLNIFRYGILSFQYISHRVLRWTITPLALAAMIPVNLYLCFTSDLIVFPILMFLQCVFYLCALTGYIYARKGLSSSIFYAAFYFVFMNLNVFQGYKYLYKRKGNGAWDKSKRSQKQ